MGEPLCLPWSGAHPDERRATLRLVPRAHQRRDRGHGITRSRAILGRLPRNRSPSLLNAETARPAGSRGIRQAGRRVSSARRSPTCAPPRRPSPTPNSPAAQRKAQADLQEARRVASGDARKQADPLRSMQMGKTGGRSGNRTPRASEMPAPFNPGTPGPRVRRLRPPDAVVRRHRRHHPAGARPAQQLQDRHRLRQEEAISAGR